MDFEQDDYSCKEIFPINEYNENERRLLTKYFQIWAKETNFKCKDKPDVNKNKQISEFLEKLLQEKNKLYSNKAGRKFVRDNDSILTVDKSDTSSQNHVIENGVSYQHRFQAQKHIIALQQAKLEQQKRYIEELKLNKVIESSSILTTTINDVKNTFSNCSVSIKPKLKCVIPDTNSTGSSTEDIFRVNCMRVPKFLQKMEQRARDREEKREIVAERRRQIELERDRVKQQKILEKQFMEQKEREDRLNEFKEKRRHDQLVAIQKKKFRDKIRALMVMADLHYEKKLILKYGISAWKLFVERVKKDHLMAIEFDKFRIIRKHFCQWKSKAQKSIEEKVKRADDLYRRKIYIRFFVQLKYNYKLTVDKQQTAIDWYERKISEVLFLTWRKYTKMEVTRQQKLWHLAVQHYERKLIWKVVGYWESLPIINKLEREHESRKQRWRSKVQQVIPDFMPEDYI